MLLQSPEGLVQEEEEVPGLVLEVEAVLGRLGVPRARLPAPSEAGVQSSQPDIYNSESEQQCSILLSQLRGLLLLPGTDTAAVNFLRRIITTEINFHPNLTLKVKTGIKEGGNLTFSKC